MEEKKIGFIGDVTSLEFFRVFGADVFSAYTVEDAYRVIKGLKTSDYATIFITEEVFDSERFGRYIMDRKLLVIPSLKSQESKKGYHIVEGLIRKATGMKE